MTSAKASRPEERILRDCLREIGKNYDAYNLGLFGGRLRRPLLEWSQATTSDGESSSSRTLGAWISRGRTLRLSVGLLDQPWGAVMEVLKHEMAHQYVDECLGGDDSGPHGALFRKVCQERGIDARAMGKPEALNGEEQDHVLKRVQRLLALAGSDNQNEAEVAMATARRLMLKYNLGRVDSGSERDYCFAHLGQPTGRRMAWQRVLANILNEYFFVEIIIVPVFRAREGKRGSVLEACGSSANLKIASYAYDFLENAALSAWKTHKREAGLRSNKDRQSYLYGVMCGFRDKLEKESDRSRREGLVWMGDPELNRYFRRRHPHVRSVSGRSSVDRDAFSAGHEAGGRIVLHRGFETGQSSSSIRLLGGRR